MARIQITARGERQITISPGDAKEVLDAGARLKMTQQEPQDGKSGVIFDVIAEDPTVVKKAAMGLGKKLGGRWNLTGSDIVNGSQ